jgi:hypothetical protein
MQNCTNCGAQISCGCQKRTATDGKAVCTSCVTAYEANLAQLNNNLNSQQNNQTQSNNV